MMTCSDFTGMCDKICYWSVNRYMDAIVTYDATSTDPINLLYTVAAYHVKSSYICTRSTTGFYTRDKNYSILIINIKYVINNKPFQINPIIFFPLLPSFFILLHIPFDFIVDPSREYVSFRPTNTNIEQCILIINNHTQ